MLFKSRLFLVRLLAAYFSVTLFFIIGFTVIFGFPVTGGQWAAWACVIAGGFAGVFLVSKYSNDTMIKPMKEIIEMTNKVARGEFSTRAKLVYTDEQINRLAYNFNKMANEFENLEQVRKDFVANASHELKSPLTSIQGFLQAILDGTVEKDEVYKYLDIAYSEAKRLGGLIRDMLDLSRIDSGKMPITKARFEINELIRRVMIRFETRLYEKKMRWGVDFVSENCYVYADKDRIEQVIVNLVDNAVKYSPPNTKIHITTHIHLNKVYISIKDQGVGISKKDQLLIWDRFYTVDKVKTPGKSKGTGLGLAIVKKIMDEHKEVIWVEGNLNQGTTFIFTLTMYNSNLHGASASNTPAIPPKHK